ncbi:MAG: TetR/AcrR family transcriptional regulator [Sporolactobacillus sp.]
MNDERPFPKHNERRDAAENRQRIIKAALHLFEQHEIEDVSMNQIASAAKVGAGTLYRRYHNKSELCLDLIQDSIERLFADIDRYLAAQHNETPAKRLVGVLELFTRFREKKIDLLKGVDESLSKPHAFVNSPLHHKMRKIFVALFDELSGDSSPMPSSTFKADLLITAFSNQFYLFQRNVRGLAPSDLLHELSALFIER